MKNRFVLFVVFLLSLPTLIFAQKNLIQSELGYAHSLKNKASGYTTGIEYQREINPRHYFGFSLNYVYTQSRGILPKNLSDNNVILRDFSNIPNLPNFGWSADAFPEIHLKSKPDTYFNLNFDISYFYNTQVLNNSSLKIGLGSVITFVDEKVISELIEGKKFVAPLQNDINDFLIPIFRYDTYIDIGLKLQLQYQFQINEKMLVGCSAKNYWFPKSKTVFWSLSPTISFKF